MPHLQTQIEWEYEISLKILDYVHSELYLDFRFLEIALSALKPKQNTALQTFATDGIYLYFSAEHIQRVFQNNPKLLSRTYLHSIFHCIFSHLWIIGNRERKLWHIACDITVEYIIDSFETPCTKRILTWIRQQTYKQLDLEKQGISAAVVYRILSKFSDKQMKALRDEFYTDDHSYWPKKNNSMHIIPQAAKKQWEKIAHQTQMQQERYKTEGSELSRQMISLLKVNQSKRSYDEFLKKFTRLREELSCNPDEFDLNYYLYGLHLYKNMPLIEPLETMETKKIQQFIIVLDTSDSTSGKLIKNFLKETFRILQQRENFFKVCQIRILQCDNQIHMDQCITSLAQLDQFFAQFQIVGGGGTDFRPAFAYINHLLEKGKLNQIDGLLYFTDGKGTYPKKRPPYKTAFLFSEDYDELFVPPWAMRYQFDRDKLESYTLPDEVSQSGGGID